MAKRDSIFDIIKSQPRATVDRIYGKDKAPDSILQSTYACKAVFQSLTMLSKCYTMRLLNIDYSFPLSDLLLWAKPESKRVHDSSVDELLRLKIIVESIETPQHYRINSYFQSSFKLAIAEAKSPWDVDESIIKKDENQEGLSITISRALSPEELNNYSMNRWNDVLGFIVNILPASHPLLKHNILKVSVQRAELMKPVDNTQQLAITSKGYEYMLKDYRSQVWEFVLTSIRCSSEKEEALSFLFMLSYCELGKGYPVAALTKAQRQLMFEFSQLGVIYLPSIQSTKFFPTGISIDMIFTNIDNIRGGAGAGTSLGHTPLVDGTSTDSQQMNVIVETNNQVVAYVTSELHLAMLKLFVEVSVRMPNMAIGRLTREKAKQAFRAGIKASQIIDFLLMHAHPNVRKRVPMIPENVTDQLTLWEAESSRIQSQKAVVVDFREVPGSSPDLFRGLIESLNKENALIWQNPTLYLIAVKPESFELVEKFFREKLGYFSY